MRRSDRCSPLGGESSSPTHDLPPNPRIVARNCSAEWTGAASKSAGNSILHRQLLPASSQVRSSQGYSLSDPYPHSLEPVIFDCVLRELPWGRCPAAAVAALGVVLCPRSEVLTLSHSKRAFESLCRLPPMKRIPQPPSKRSRSGRSTVLLTSLLAVALLPLSDAAGQQGGNRSRGPSERQPAHWQQDRPPRCGHPGSAPGSSKSAPRRPDHRFPREPGLNGPGANQPGGGNDNAGIGQTPTTRASCP